MSRVHGKDTYISVDAADISPHCDASEFNPTVDSHDVTGYGSGGHKFGPGLTNGTFTCSGKYDSTASTGPRAVFRPLMKTPALVEVIRRVEGTGSGKPEDTFQALVTSYTESNPVADYVTWQAQMQISGDVDDTPQGP